MYFYVYLCKIMYIYIFEILRQIPKLLSQFPCGKSYLASGWNYNFYHFLWIKMFVSVHALNRASTGTFTWFKNKQNKGIDNGIDLDDNDIHGSIQYTSKQLIDVRVILFALARACRKCGTITYAPFHPC